MQYHKTSSLVESGILAAVAVLFTLVGNYVPVLDLIVSILWPLPIILCGRRNGLKWSVLCLVVTGVVVSVLLSPMQALTQCVILGLIGLFMGYAMRKQMSPVNTLLMGSLGALISTLLSALAAYYLMDVNVIQVFFDSIDESISMSGDLLKTMGMGGFNGAQLDQLKKMFELILPAGIILSAPVTAMANYWAARKILARMGDYYPWFPPFALWKLPKWLLLPYGIGMMLIFFGQNYQDSWLYRGGYTLYMMMNMLLLVQGLCLIRWYVEYKHYPRILIPLSLILTFTIPIASQLIVVLGAYEMVFDLRKIRKPVQKQENTEEKK